MNFTTVRENDADETDVNAVMAAAHDIWSREMIAAIKAGVVADGENPTTLLQAVIDDGGDEYIATLTYSVQRNVN